MTSKLSNIRRLILALSIVWFAGYASATTVCANSCPDCVSVSLNSCSASCSAVSVPSLAEVKVKFTKLVVLQPEIALIYASVNTANIWKPPKQTVTSSFESVV